MLDIGWQEFLIVLAVALVVVGPRDLPKALQTVGRWVSAARRMGRDFQRHFDDVVREADLDDVKKGLQQARSFSPRRQIETLVDPDGELRGAMDPKADQKASSNAVDSNAANGKAPDTAAATVEPIAGRDPQAMADPAAEANADQAAVAGGVPQPATTAGASSDDRSAAGTEAIDAARRFDDGRGSWRPRAKLPPQAPKSEPSGAPTGAGAQPAGEVHAGGIARAPEAETIGVGRVVE